jgi:F-type H+-transporting ATPase subunit delta
MPGQHSQHTSPVAAAYAQSLLELAIERNTAEAIGQELGDLKKIVAENPSFRAFLSNPGISEAERGEVIKRTFEGRVNPLLLNFLNVLNDKGRLASIIMIADAYDDLLDEKLGKVEVDVTVAQKLSAEQLEEVRRRVSAALGKDAVIHQYVDESIIGGLVLRVQDKLIDSSVRSQLRALRDKLLAARPA